jgi:hypothetical protein
VCACLWVRTGADTEREIVCVWAGIGVEMERNRDRQLE